RGCSWPRRNASGSGDSGEERPEAGGRKARPYDAEAPKRLLSDGLVGVVVGGHFGVERELRELRGHEALVDHFFFTELLEEAFDLRVPDVLDGLGEEDLGLALAVEGDLEGLAAGHEGAGLLVIRGLDVEEHRAVHAARLAAEKGLPALGQLVAVLL